MRKAVAPPLTLGLGWKDSPEVDRSSTSSFVPRAAVIWQKAEQKVAAAQEADRAQTNARLRQHYHIAIQQLQSERQAIIEGTHPELVVRSSGLKRRRAETHSNAKKMLEAKEEHLRRLLESEEASIEHEFQSCVDKVKERVSSDLDKRQKHIENRLQGAPDDERANTRSLRSKASKDEEQEPELPIMSSAPKVPSSTAAAVATSKRSKRAFSPASMLLDKTLDEDDIKKDKWDIAREDHIIQHGATTPRPTSQGKRKTSTSGEATITAHAKSGRLTYGGEIFVKGETVVVVVTDGSNSAIEMSGSIQCVNSTEVHVKVGNGSKHRVYLSHLRNGKAVLSRRSS